MIGKGSSRRAFSFTEIANRLDDQIITSATEMIVAIMIITISTLKQAQALPE
jgi:hypothetical protein